MHVLLKDSCTIVWRCLREKTVSYVQNVSVRLSVTCLRLHPNFTQIICTGRVVRPPWAAETKGRENGIRN